MTLSATGEYNTGGFHSHGCLVNPHKGGKIERICQSEPFLKPKLSLSTVTFICQKILSRLKFKAHGSLTEEKISESQDFNRPSKKMPMSNKENSPRTLKQKNKSEQVISEKTSKTAGSVKISKKDWQHITKSSAKVILDPNTANPTLKLTVDGRSVRTKTFKEFQSSNSYYEYQRKYKHQYNCWPCVQAEEGYSTGRHYWEVDVKGKCDWRVGVVKESAKRNGFINLNTAAGYWTLRLQLGSLMALTEPVTKLNQAPPTKIGVSLDLEEDRVSFYDAVERKEIYTFNAEFREDEKIYPVFGTVETEKPLKIV